MNAANPLWGAPRIHGELLKLGIEVSQSTVAKYLHAASLQRCGYWERAMVTLAGASLLTQLPSHVNEQEFLDAPQAIA